VRLKFYNFVAPLEEAGAPVTSEPDANVGAR
jgi:probable phosphoglycerate mutase